MSESSLRNSFTILSVFFIVWPAASARSRRPGSPGHRHGIGEWHAELDHVGAGPGQALDDLERGLVVGIARGYKGDEGSAAFRLEGREAAFDATHSFTPSTSATVKMSLSPRPQRFITMR